jgi:hypothetical protein
VQVAGSGSVTDLNTTPPVVAEREETRSNPKMEGEWAGDSVAAEP